MATATKVVTVTLTLDLEEARVVRRALWFFNAEHEDEYTPITEGIRDALNAVDHPF